MQTSIDAMNETITNLPGQVSGAMNGIVVYMDGTAVGHVVAPTVGSDLASQATGTFAFEG